jgi:hypothetical protein
LLEVYKMISNPKIFFFMLQPREDIFHFNDLDLKRLDTNVKASKHFMAEVYIIYWQHKQE